MLDIQSFYKRSRAENRSTERDPQLFLCVSAVKQDALGSAFLRSPD